MILRTEPTTSNRIQLIMDETSKVSSFLVLRRVVTPPLSDQPVIKASPLRSPYFQRTLL